MQRIRKPLSILLSLVMVLGMFAVVPLTVGAQAAVTYTEYSWNGSALQTTDRTVTEYTVVTSSLSSMTSGTYVVNSDTTIENYVTVQKGKTANLVVMDGVTLTCNKGIGCGLNKNNEYASLNIFGTGKIVATGKSKAAGIGGDDDEANGNITIHGTTIEATGGKHGAGIGGGEGGKDPNADSPNIKIFEGSVTAKGGVDGAGIGGGDSQPGARTYIYGGTIDARSEKHGAGIGGGDEEGTYGVYIYGGTITAKGGSHGAGIGAGEEGGNLRDIEEDGGGINISGGTVTAEGGSSAPGIGGGYEEDTEGTITISGNANVKATGMEEAAGIGAGSSGNFMNTGDMDGTVIIKGNPKVVVKGGKSAAGIGGGERGSMSGGLFIMLGGDVEVTSGEAGAGIGGGREGGVHEGGEGGTCYIGGGSLKIFPIHGINYTAPGQYSPPGNSLPEPGETIGRGYDDSVSGTVIYSYNGDFPASVPHTGMKVIYSDVKSPNDSKIAKAGDRSTKSHAYYILDISECDHKDLSGKSVLTYTIDKNTNTHTEKCKYCGLNEKVECSGGDCVCGRHSDQCTVTLKESGSANVAVAYGKEFTLPDYENMVMSSGTQPNLYHRVTGWKLSDDTSGKVYEQAENVTVDRDMTFTSETEDLYRVSFDEVAHGSIHADITNNEAYAAAGETLEFGVEADPGYSVSKVTYRLMTGFNYDNNNNIIYQYSDPVEIQPVDGKYQLTMPEFSASYNNMIVISAETIGNTANPITISENIENGTVTSDKETAAPNQTVTLTVAPDENYRLVELRCRAADGSELEPTKVNDTQYTFTMPAMSVSVTAEFELADDFTALQAIIDSASNGDTVELAFDYTAREGESCLTVPSGKTITLDLNGHTVDRALEAVAANGNVFTNNGTLTITGNGMITGGRNTEDGGAIYNSGTLTINEGVAIIGNASSKSGGAISAHGGTITINGGEINNNTAGSHGGAIYLGYKGENIAVLNLCGGTITGNAATGSDSQGGGICNNGTLNASGNPVVKNNTTPAYNKGHNIYLRSGKKVNVTGELTDGAEIGVTAPGGGTGVFTSGLSGNGTADSFFSDNPDYYVDVNGSGEGTLAQYYVFSFDSNGGSGEQETIRSKTNEIELPDCTFTAPEGRCFMAWNVGGTEMQPGDTVTITSGYTMTATAVWADAYHIEIEDGIVNGTVSADAEYAAEGQTVTLTVTPDESYVLQELYVVAAGTDPIILDPEASDFSFTMPAQDVVIHAYFAKGTAYVDAKGNDMPAKIAQELVSSDTEWGGSVSAGETTSWYYAEGEVTINDRVTVTGNVNLILCDGATLTIPKGIKVAKGTGLTIWQQKGGTGHLVIEHVADWNAAIGSDRIGSGTASDKTAGSVTINGGILDVVGGYGAAAIGGGSGGCSGGTITINGGKVNARSVRYGAAIGGGWNGKAGSVTINGGTVNATAYMDGAAIGQGAGADLSQPDSVMINGGTVRATIDPQGTSSLSVMNGSAFTLNYDDESKYTMSVMAESWSGAVTLSKKFADENGSIYGVGEIDNNDTLAGKTLRPYDGMGVKLTGHSISLDGDIAVNYYMELSQEIINSEDAYVQFSIPDASTEYRDQKVYVKAKAGEDRIVATEKDGCYVFKCRVPAKDMGTKIKAQLINGAAQGTTYTYSVKDYADYLLAHTGDNAEYAKAAPLVKAMLNYGAYAQLYFDKNTGALANADLSAEDKELGDVTIEIADYDNENLPKGTSFEGVTLSLKSETTLSLYFESSDDLEFSCDGYEVETDAKNGVQVARIRGIKAKNIGDTFTLNVNGDTVTYSPLNYCKNVLANDTQPENLQNVVKALYLYWQAAADYFKP